ncbi:MAG: hypothetical protein LAT82_00230 [Nanoarchaeota archaeon]|nr:hypothetical protein [Nanoarchaeota archaeon]
MTVEIYGNSKDCIDFALNQNGITIDKIIITRDEFVEKLANPQTIQALLRGCSQLTTEEQFKKLLNNEEVQEALKTPINPDYVRNLSQKFQEFFSSFDQVELKNYSFMNSMNSDTFNITLRTQSNCQFSIYNIDKNALQSSFEEVFSKYFNSLSTLLSVNELQFQIEITKFDDYKKVFNLYKQGSKLLLFSQLGLPVEVQGSLYQVYGEQYSSYKNVLFYNEAKQEVMYCKQGSKLGYEQVHIKGKILEEQELISIHQTTSSLNDVIVEGYINHKGKVQLTHIQVFTLPIEESFEDKLLLYKSTKISENTHQLVDAENTQNISLIPFHEVDLSTPHPKFVILRNSAEFKSALSSRVFEKVDGVLFTFSIFSHQLLTICSNLNITYIISKKEFSKSQDSQINWSTLEITNLNQNSSDALQDSQINPFSSILPQKTQETIDRANELNSIQEELNSQAQIRSQELHSQRHQQQEYSRQPQEQQSTYSNTNPHSQPSSNSSSLYGSLGGSGGGSKKSALAMLADSVLNAPQRPTPQQASTPPQPEVTVAQEFPIRQEEYSRENLEPIQNSYNSQSNSSSQINPFNSNNSTNISTNSNYDMSGFDSNTSNSTVNSNSNNLVLDYISKRLEQLEQEKRELQELYNSHLNK